MYASQTKRLCVRGAQSDETRVQHHSSSEATTGSGISTQTHQTNQPRIPVVVVGNNMTASAASNTGDSIETAVASATSSPFPYQPSPSHGQSQQTSNAQELSAEHELINKLANETIEEAKLELLLSIRNLITACNRKKDSIVCNPNFTKIINLIDDDKPSSTVKTQLALLICSVAKSGEHNVRVLNKSLVDDKIFNLILNSQDEVLVEACLRCMRSIMSWPKVSRTWLFYESQPLESNNSSKVTKDISLNRSSLQKIIAYARGTNSLVVQECVADIFAATCARNKDQVLLYKASAVPCIVQLIESPSERVIIAALNWLTQMCHKNSFISLEVTKTTCPSGRYVLDQLSSLMSKESCCELQFLSARCFANIYKALGIENFREDPRIANNVLPTLVGMVHPDKPPFLRVKAAECIAYLIECDTRLQNVASVCNHLIDSLANMLEYEYSSTYIGTRNCNQNSHKFSSVKLLDRSGGAWRGISSQLPPPPILHPSVDLRTIHLDSTNCDLDADYELNQEMKRSAFLALAALASNLEPIRKKIFNTCSIMQHLVRSLNDGDTKTLKSVLTCLLSLSRSVQQLRTSFNENNVYSALKSLLTTTSNDVLILVLAILCNVSLDFSPGKQHFLDDTTIEVLCKLTRSSDPFMKLHGMWILMNMVYQLKDESMKFRILRSLGIKNVLGMLETNDDDDLVIKTLGFLRNLLSQTTHIDNFMNNHGDLIMQSLIRILEKPTSTRVKEQTLCVLTNIADGIDSKKYIMKNQVVLDYLARIICDERAGDLRLAAICCITNLAHKENEGSYERRDEMKKFGIDDKLRALLNTNDPNLSDRVRTAYNQFSIGTEEKYSLN